MPVGHSHGKCRAADIGIRKRVTCKVEGIFDSQNCDSFKMDED